MVSRLLSIILLFGLAGCATGAAPWHLDSIATGDKAFDSKRLIYQDPASQSRLRVEFIRVGADVDLFLSLSQYTLTPSSLDPPSILVEFKIEGEPPFQEMIALHEGKMRLRVPSPIKDRIASALQGGKKVGILVDDFEETLSPEQFAKTFEQFSGFGLGFENFLKGMY